MISRFSSFTPPQVLFLCIGALSCGRPVSTDVGAATIHGVEEGDARCANGLDDDADGYVDCADRDCALMSSVCASTEVELAGGCENDRDDDADGFVDGSDTDCRENTADQCDDGIDNDDNGYTDCEDYGCSKNPDLAALCGVAGEDNDAACVDGQDNDGDGYTDCEDYDCSRSDTVTVCCSPGNPTGHCAEGAECVSGVCASPCSDDLPGGSCPDGQVCRGGQCQGVGPCAPDEPTGTCPEGLGCMGGACSELGSVREVGQVVITEIYPDAEGDENKKEWFELYNPGAVPLDLRGLTVKDEGDDTFVVESSLALVIAPGGYAVLARSTNGAENGGVPAIFAFGNAMALANSGDEIIVEAAGVVIDAIHYGSSFPYREGVAVGVNPERLDAASNDEEANWCAQETAWGDGAALGTPGQENTPCGG